MKWNLRLESSWPCYSLSQSCFLKWTQMGCLCRLEFKGNTGSIKPSWLIFLGKIKFYLSIHPPTHLFSYICPHLQPLFLSLTLPHLFLGSLKTLKYLKWSHILQVSAHKHKTYKIQKYKEKLEKLYLPWWPIITFSGIFQDHCSDTV